MMKRVVTGILMEVGEDSAIIMTKEGEFLKVKKPSPNVSAGEEITSTTVDVNRYSFMKYAAIAATFLLLLIPFTYFQQAMATVAYVNVDINPSLEMGINKYNKVNSVKALNSDGEALVKDMPLKDLDINEALDKVISGAKEKGYINDDKQNNIEIALVTIKESQVNISQESLVKYAENLAPKINVDATVKIQGADKKLHDEAQKENLSTNKYIDKSKDKDNEAVKVKIKKDNKKEDNKDTEKAKPNSPEKKEEDNKKKDNKKVSLEDEKDDKISKPLSSSGAPAESKGKGNNKK